MMSTILVTLREMLLNLWTFIVAFFCAIAWNSINADYNTVCNNAAHCMRSHAAAYKKHVKSIESKFKLLKLPGASLFGSAFGYSKKELKQAHILGRFFASGSSAEQAITAVANGEGAEILERVFSQLKKKFSTLRGTPKIRTVLIELLHQEMMHALGLKGSKSWFCKEIERKHNKHYIINGEAFNIYLHQTAVALFAIYWFETQIPS